MRHSDPVSSSRGPSHRGFTLVELLIVVGIIAILIAFLMPALKKAREAAVTTSCLSNLHQLELAIHLYSNLSGGWWPSTGYGADFRLAVPATSTTTALTWPERICRQGAIPIPSSSAVFSNPGRWTVCGGGSQYYPICGRGMFKCPGYGGGAFEHGQTDVRAQGYAQNRLLAPEITSTHQVGFIRLSKIPSGIVTIMDGWIELGGSATLPQAVRANVTVKALDGVTVANAYDFGIYLRHSDGANYLFADGHAEWSKAFNRTGYSTPGNVWADGTRITSGGPSPSFVRIREVASGDNTWP